MEEEKRPLAKNQLYGDLFSSWLYFQFFLPLRLASSLSLLLLVNCSVKALMFCQSTERRQEKGCFYLSLLVSAVVS